MEAQRKDPEAWLRQLKLTERTEGRGELKIFFGYAAGVGKTYAMLEAACAAQQRGVDVAVGYVEPHARPQTMQLLQGLECLPTKVVRHGDLALQEFDLDGALARKPQLLLLDELAHTNAPGSRHQKRYQDVEELLRQGIDVYTTVNVQHLESLNDAVAGITGVTVQERIPDAVFDNAAQVELVDIEPKELLERLREGKIYRQAQAERAMQHFFTEENLTALREIALRRCADRVNRLAQQSGQAARSCFAGEHILVCLSSSPTNPKIIRTAARMAQAFQGTFTALFVETPEFQSMNGDDRKRLQQNMQLAQQLGAVVETVYGDDIAFQIAEFARLSGVSKIVLGRSSSRRRIWPGQLSLTEKITALSPNLDIHIIPDQSTPIYREKRHSKRTVSLCYRDVLKSGLVLAAATALGGLFFQLGFQEANIITVYILGVLITAVITAQRCYSLVSAVVSVLLFNFLFTSPRFTLDFYDARYAVTFLIILLSAFLTSSLAIRMKQQARQAAVTAYRTQILFDTSQLLSSQQEGEGIITVTCQQLQKLLQKDILFYPVQDTTLAAAPMLFALSEQQAHGAYYAEQERAVAMWVYHNNKQAGATTNTLGSAQCRYLAVRVGQDIFGVVGIALRGVPLDAFENSIVLSILGECALALQNKKISQEREKAALLAKNEQLRADLLRSISHDLRTPLTSISGSAGILLAGEEQIAPEKRRQLYGDIYDDALWLINLVENLLSVTRIEDGTMKLRLETELLDEIVTEALRHSNRKSAEHQLRVIPADTFVLVKVDGRLLMQVIINLVDNAIKYTPQGSEIVVRTTVEDGWAVLTVADNGEGISDEDKAHIFEMFYTAGSNAADGRRSLGLGLALCKAIVTAHGGTIQVADNQPHGAVFTVRLPIEEVTVHE